MNLFTYSTTFKVPKKWKFLDVLDMFIKVHKVFYLDYHTHLVHVMKLFGHFIYKMNEDNRLDARVLEMKNIILGIDSV